MTNWLVTILKRLIGWLDKPDTNPVDEAVRLAFVSVGLPSEQYNENFDLVRAGKLTDVYHQAARILNTDPELNTVGDVIKWLKD